MATSKFLIRGGPPKMEIMLAMFDAWHERGSPVKQRAVVFELYEQGDEQKKVKVRATITGGDARCPWANRTEFDIRGEVFYYDSAAGHRYPVMGSIGGWRYHPFSGFYDTVTRHGHLEVAGKVSLKEVGTQTAKMAEG